MFGLSLGKKVFVGIDVGSSAVKIVEIKVVGGKPVLSNYAWMSLGKLTGAENDRMAHFETVLPQYIKKMIKDAKIKGTDAHVSLPAFGGLITLIDFPEMAKEDMEQAIRFEAQKYIPVPLEEVVLSWDIIERNGHKKENGKENAPVEKAGTAEGEAKIRVLLVAASRNTVEKYEKLIKKVGLRLRSLEIEGFSMVRSLVGSDLGNFVIVDIGARICNILLVRKGIIIANRNIDAGGKDITRTIAKSMGLDEAGAERMKISGKNFFSHESSLNLPALEIISGEISRLIDSSYGSTEKFSLDGIILSGGTARLAGLPEYLSRITGVKVTIGDPFGRISYSDKLGPVLSRIGSQFSVATGLALKGAENYLK